jgi:hypothetical protein
VKNNFSKIFFLLGGIRRGEKFKGKTRGYVVFDSSARKTVQVMVSSLWRICGIDSERLQFEVICKHGLLIALEVMVMI